MPSTPADPLAGIRGFLHRNGRYTTYSAFGFAGTFPFDINNRGEIAGFAISDADATEVHSFVYAHGVDGIATRFDVPGAARTVVYGLDDRGRLVGHYEIPNAMRPQMQSMPRSMPGASPLGLGPADRTP